MAVQQKGSPGWDLADHCNCYFAIMGLYAAHEIGVSVDIETWRRARDHWLSSQNSDGSWAYKEGNHSADGTGSMTAAGVTALVVTQSMVQSAEKDLKIDASRKNLDDQPIDKPVDDACRWLGNHFSVENNPRNGRWYLYYLHVLAEAGRFSQRQFLVDSRGQQHDWYGEAADYLVGKQNQFTGTWQDDSSAVIGTSFVLRVLNRAPKRE